MHDGIDYSEIGRKERIGDVVSYAMPLRNRKPGIDMHMQVGHIRAAISADANLVHFHDAGDIAGKRLDRGGLAADFSVNELLKRRIGDLPRDMEDEQRDKNRANRVHPCKRRPDMRDDDRDGDGDRADGVRPVVPGVGLERGGGDLPRDAACPAKQPFLRGDRDKRDKKRREPRNRRLARDERADGVCAKFVGDDDKRDRDEERHQRLDLAVPVGMLFIGGSRPIAHAKYHRKVRHQVGERMHCVSEQRLRREHDANAALQHRNRDVDGHADVCDAPNLVDSLVFGSHGFHVVAMKGAWGTVERSKRGKSATSEISSPSSDQPQLAASRPTIFSGRTPAAR